MTVLLWCLVWYLVVGLAFFAVFLVKRHEWRDGLDDVEARFLYLVAAGILVLGWPLVVYVCVREGLESSW
jgi:hypothetical protein